MNATHAQRADARVAGQRILRGLRARNHPYAPPLTNVLTVLGDDGPAWREVWAICRVDPPGTPITPANPYGLHVDYRHPDRARVEQAYARLIEGYDQTNLPWGIYHWRETEPEKHHPEGPL